MDNIFDNLKKSKRQARQLSGNAVVVPWGKARKAMQRLVSYYEKRLAELSKVDPSRDERTSI